MVSQALGFYHDDPAREWPQLPSRPVRVGGVTVTVAQARAALAALSASGGIMVRQVLAAAGNPLASCDYHAAAAPFLGSASLSGPRGRGAAGRPVTKAAFMAAIAEALERAEREEPARHHAGSLAGARAVFGSDFRCAAAMADAAVALRRRAHSAHLRETAASAARIAVARCAVPPGSCAAASACGTGDCMLASGVLAELRVPAPAGRIPRPAGHARAGEGFGIAAAVAALEAAVPYRAAVHVASADRARAADAAAA